MALMTSADLADFPHPPPDHRIAYGDDPLQFGDLRIPEGEGPHPVVIFIHGGQWKAEFDISHSDKLTDALTRHGIATWSLEYRRVGNAGGGWPGTFLDIGAGADHLREIAAEHNLDLDRTIAMGHSAGGHLAIWLASRASIPSDSALYMDEPIALRGVVGLAPAADLTGLHATEFCGDIIEALMGGSPEEVPEHYRWGDPVQFSPGHTPQILVFGKHDSVWSPSGLSYFDVAVARGDQVRMTIAPDSGHFEMIDPDTDSFNIVLAAAVHAVVGN